MAGSGGKVKFGGEDTHSSSNISEMFLVEFVDLII